jgi:hypothetical protein
MQAGKIEKGAEHRLFGEEIRRCEVFRGRLMGADGREHLCQAAGISCHYIVVHTSYCPAIGERVVIYFEGWDRFAGTVARLIVGGFALLYEATQRRREKIAARLDWVTDQPQRMTLVMREGERIVPRHRASKIVYHGRIYDCEIQDISRKGAVLKTRAKIAVGSRLEIGKGYKAEVVREIVDGLSIQFLRLLPLEIFDENIRL